MRTRSAIALVVLALAASCKTKSEPKKRAPAASPAPADLPKTPPDVVRPNAKPPLPVAHPPGDAQQITGLPGAPTAIVYVKTLTPGAGEHPGRNDTALMNLSGWRTNGETFMSSKSRNRPVPMSLAMVAPGFAAGVQAMRPGERAMLWVPPELGYMGPPQDVPETTVYEVELVSVEPSPTTPPDVATPPADAVRSRSGLISKVVKPGTGTVNAKSYDAVTFQYSAWDSTGRMFDSSEIRKRPKETYGFREWPGIEEALTLMRVGERRRVWIPPALADASLPGLPQGTLCYELELTKLTPMKAPPSAPLDLKTPPADAIKTATGVTVKVLKAGTGTAHPTPTDRVKVHYTGWSVDGRLIDSSIPRATPGEYVVGKLMPGWADALQTMTTGERARVWIPVERAFRNEPGRPQGELVFDLELLEVSPGSAPPSSAPTGVIKP